MITRSTLATSVAEQIQSLILAGRFKPGEFLPPQKELAEQYGVGISTIREAVQMLSASGLLRSHPGKGTWVTEERVDGLISPQVVKSRLGELNARQVYEARCVIEVALTRMAAQRAGEEDIQRITAALLAMQAAQDDRHFVEADLSFHLAVAAAAHNHLLEQFYHLTRKLLEEIITEMVQLPDVKQESINLQQAIADAIRNGDSSAATKAAQRHMDYIESLLNLYE